MSRAFLLTTFGLALAVLGCAHTHAATDAPAVEASAEPAAPPSDQPAETARPTKHHARAAPGSPSLFASPEAALAPDGVEKIQAKLVERGELDETEASGHLNDATKRALIALQKKSNLPATGVPDDTTVRKLGLDPAAIFRKAPPP
jgi:Putative peptidoglycan binding domain